MTKAQKRYEVSEKGKARHRRYNASAKGIATRERYEQSEKAQARYTRHYRKLQERFDYHGDAKAMLPGLKLIEALQQGNFEVVEIKPKWFIRLRVCLELWLRFKILKHLPKLRHKKTKPPSEDDSWLTL